MQNKCGAVKYSIDEVDLSITTVNFTDIFLLIKYATFPRIL